METSHQYYVGSIEGGITPQKQHDLSVDSLVKCSYCVTLLEATALHLSSFYIVGYSVIGVVITG